MKNAGFKILISVFTMLGYSACLSTAKADEPEIIQFETTNEEVMNAEVTPEEKVLEEAVGLELLSPAARKPEVIKIEYSSSGFLIDGKKTVEKAEFVSNLRIFSHAHLEADYVFYTDVKPVEGETQEIRSMIEETGVKLQHFCVPQEESMEENNPCGAGFVDLQTHE